MQRSETIGIGLALASATAFGATTIIGKLSYRENIGVPTLLAVRFALGAVMLWAIVLFARTPRVMPRGRALVLLALGGIGYGTQSRMFFEALARIPAATAGLLLYAYPALVAVLALVLGREKMGAGKAVALALGLGGTALVLGAPASDLDALGVALALGSAVAYAIYILAAERAIAGISPLVSSATIVTGGAIAFLVTGGVTGSIDLDVGISGWAWLLALALVSITIAVTTFVASVERIGPTRASIVSTWEPVVTVLLAALTLHERLSALQLLGGACVVAAVAVLPLTSRGRSGAHSGSPSGKEELGRVG